MKYVVTDEEGNVSWNAKTEGAEAFKTFDAAKRRAEGLAKLAPGQTIRVYEMRAEVVAPVGAVTTRRQ